MKLKYYLRGLGTGIAVTALILGMSFSNRQEQTEQTMTDAQIRERAAELGMVDSGELTLAALQNSAKQQTENTAEETTQTQETQEQQEQIETTAEPEETAAQEAVESKTPVTLEKTAEPETVTEPETITEPEVMASDAATEPAAAVTPEESTEPEAPTVPEQAQTNGIIIQRGADSGSVSRQLYEAGLVENAKAFDEYLCNNGYSRSINPGIYEIAPGTSEEEIAKIITGKQ